MNIKTSEWIILGVMIILLFLSWPAKITYTIPVEDIQLTGYPTINPSQSIISSAFISDSISWSFDTNIFDWILGLFGSIIISGIVFWIIQKTEHVAIQAIPMAVYLFSIPSLFMILGSPMVYYAVNYNFGLSYLIIFIPMLLICYGISAAILRGLHKKEIFSNQLNNSSKL